MKLAMIHFSFPIRDIESTLAFYRDPGARRPD